MSKPLHPIFLYRHSAANLEEVIKGALTSLTSSMLKAGGQFIAGYDDAAAIKERNFKRSVSYVPGRGSLTPETVITKLVQETFPHLVPQVVA